ncbi:MAG: ATP-binding protein, partial [Byssovorax sp.]
IQKNMQLVETKEQLEHRVSDLKLLFDLESAMSGAQSMEDLARAVVTEAARACDGAAGAILVDEQEGGIWLYYVDYESVRGKLGLHAGDHATASGAAITPAHAAIEVKRVAMKRNEGVIGWAMFHNEALSLPADLERLGGEDGLESPVSGRLSTMLNVQVSSAIAVPLDGEQDEAVGAIALYNSRKPGGFSQDDRALLRLISANASTAVRLFRSRVERERSERLTTIGRLLSGVMHDMRTPLTVISGYVQLMATATDAQQRSEHARLILKQFDLLSAMQREVLEFARGERSILVRKVYLTKFFEDVEKQLRHELDGTHVDLVFQLEDRGVARFDESKLTRVLHNLARNGIEAMGARGGKLTLRVSREGTDLVVTVSDTGKGIPKDIEDKLFQSFVTSGKRGGTGLGLAIVKKIVDEHAGTITVKSTPHGATFIVRLPQDGPPQPAAPPFDRRQSGRPPS